MKDSQWLGLALRSESDQPHEWAYLAWVIRNRVEYKGRPFHQESYRDIILAPSQFSFFNQFSGLHPSEVWDLSIQKYAGDSEGWSHNNLSEAIECADWVINSPRWLSPIGPDVLYFWAPGAMGGKDPRWADFLEEVIEIPGLHRWKFGRGLAVNGSRNDSA